MLIPDKHIHSVEPLPPPPPSTIFKGENNNIRRSSKLPEAKGSGKQSEDHHIVCSVFTFFWQRLLFHIIYKISILFKNVFLSKQLLKKENLWLKVFSENIEWGSKSYKKWYLLILKVILNKRTGSSILYFYFQDWKYNVPLGIYFSFMMSHE